MQSTPAYYANIPATVRYDSTLSPNAKLLYGEITALCNKEGFCWASNRYFADLYGVAATTVSEWVRLLQKAGHISYQVTNQNTRKIFIIEPSGKPEGGYQKKPKGGRVKSRNHPSGKAEHNTTVNTTVNKNSEDVASPSKNKQKIDPFVWVDYLKRMDEHTKRHVQVIAFYFRERKVSFDTLEKAQAGIRRHLRPAKELAVFSDDEITKAADVAKRDYKDMWTVETLIKILTK